MAEIKLQVGSPHVLRDHLHAAIGRLTTGTDVRHTLEAALAQIDEQVKPAVQEPQEFGSIVQAWHPNEDPSGTPPDLWQRSPMHGKHYWENRNGVIEVWSDLLHPEVLRVGIGERSDEWQRLDVANAQTDAYTEGAEALRTKALAVLRFQLSSAITAERKDAYETAIRAVEQVQP